MKISEEILRKVPIQNLKRLAVWLDVIKKPSKSYNEEFSLLIYGILRAIKELEKSPRGTLPVELKKKRK